MRRDLRDKIETLPPDRQEKIKARSEELMERYELELEVKKLRAENIILHEEIRLREVIMGKKGREALGVKK